MQKKLLLLILGVSFISARPITTNPHLVENQKNPLALYYLFEGLTAADIIFGGTVAAGTTYTLYKVTEGVTENFVLGDYVWVQGWNGDPDPFGDPRNTPKWLQFTSGAIATILAGQVASGFIWEDQEAQELANLEPKIQQWKKELEKNGYAKYSTSRGDGLVFQISENMFTATDGKGSWASIEVPINGGKQIVSYVVPQFGKEAANKVVTTAPSWERGLKNITKKKNRVAFALSNFFEPDLQDVASIKTFKNGRDLGSQKCRALQTEVGEILIRYDSRPKDKKTWFFQMAYGQPSKTDEEPPMGNPKQQAWWKVQNSKPLSQRDRDLLWKMCTEDHNQEVCRWLEEAWKRSRHGLPITDPSFVVNSVSDGSGRKVEFSGDRELSEEEKRGLGGVIEKSLNHFFKDPGGRYKPSTPVVERVYFNSQKGELKIVFSVYSDGYVVPRRDWVWFYADGDTSKRRQIWSWIYETTNQISQKLLGKPVPSWKESNDVQDYPDNLHGFQNWDRFR